MNSQSPVGNRRTTEITADQRTASLFAERFEYDRVEQLHRDYLELTRIKLPSMADRFGWSIKHDHCFMRIVLDQLFQDCWYNHLSRRVAAYRQLSESQLAAAIRLAEKILESGAIVLQDWNRQSLEWRERRVSPACSQDGS